MQNFLNLCDQESSTYLLGSGLLGTNSGPSFSRVAGTSSDPTELCPSSN